MPVGNNSVFGVFGLNEVRSARVQNVWLNKESVANHGWFGGGLQNGSLSSSVNRLNFFNDTNTTTRGSLSLAKYILSSTSNSNYGWFGGGLPGPLSTVERIDFSNDSETGLVRGPLSLSRFNSSAVGNSNYGWFGGGVSPSIRSTVDRIDFSNDSLTSPRSPLSSTRYGSSSVSNFNYGWFCSGSITPASPGVTTIDRIDFSNDLSLASSRGLMSIIRRYGSGATGNSNYGWFGGSAGPAVVSTVDRIDFSNDFSTALIRGPLSRIKYDLAATGNSNYGWFGGGYDTSPGFPPFDISSIDRINFSNDTATAVIRTQSPLRTRGHSATSGVLNIRRQKGGNFGWFGGGYATSPPGSGGQRSTVDRIDFSNDSSTASVRGSLSAARYWFTATSNSDYGWFGGGISFPSIIYSTVDRIDFSNDSLTASIRRSLQTSKTRFSATGNSNYGWFGGGTTIPGPTFTTFSSVERINFSSDLSAPSPRGSLSAARYDMAATGNSNYGWFGGGSTTSIVNRIDFSNDSPIASTRSPLSSSRYRHAATGNSNYGWFAGGGNPGLLSTVDRINFSNDLIAATSRGLLSLSRDLRGNSSVSNTSIG